MPTALTPSSGEIEIEGKTIVVLHGHQLGSPSAEALHDAYPDADVIVYGHTHRQRIDRLDGCLIVNPGAAGAALISRAAP